MLKTYNELVEAGQLRPDKAQAKLAAKLDALEKDIYQHEEDSNSFRAKYFRRKPKAPNGFFVYGKVGRGKSMLVDLFYEKLDIKHKNRMHFHEFMKKVHDEIHLFRTYGAANPTEQVAHEFAKDLTLFCFDEYEVNDVADAMILTRLFDKMMEEGVILIFTSNRKPEEHYKNGLQRNTYVDFCKFLKTRVEVFSLNSEQDYRTIESNSEIENYFFPLGYQSTRSLKERYKELGGSKLEKVKLEVKGRELNFKASGKIMWSNFKQLCGQPLGSGDYLEIAEKFDVLVLEDIPKMKVEDRNEARRFCTLVDILYENKIIMLTTAQVDAAELYTSGTGDFEFKRTVSRLTEMRSWKL